MVKLKKYLIVVLLGVSLILFEGKPLLMVGSALLCVLVGFPRKLFPLMNYRFLIMIGLLLIVPPVLSVNRSANLFGIPYDPVLLHITINMTARGIVVFLMLQVALAGVGLKSLIRRIDSLGFSSMEALYDRTFFILPAVRGYLKAGLSTAERARRKKTPGCSWMRKIENTFSLLLKMSESPENFIPKHYSIVHPVELTSGDMAEMEHTIILVTGYRKAGKTAYLKNLFSVIKTNSADSVDGVLTERFSVGNGTKGQEVIFLGTGERNVLNSKSGFTTAVRWGRYFFREDTILRVNEYLAEIAHYNRWIIIDEFGPLEFRREGFYDGFKAVVKAGKSNLVVSLRTRLLPQWCVFLRQYIPEVLNYSHVVVKIDEPDG